MCTHQELGILLQHWLPMAFPKEWGHTWGHQSEEEPVLRCHLGADGGKQRRSRRVRSRYHQSKKSKEKEKAKAQTTWEQCNGQISALPLPLTLALCSEHMMPQDAHHWIGNNILWVDKVRGKEQRRANCAGYFRWTVRKHTLLPIASLLEVLHHFVARSVVLGKMGASKTQRET